MTGQQLKNSILQMAVQGKLVPQDPNDEPASVLLERIRKEKEQLIKDGKIKKEKNPSIIFRGADNLPYEKVDNNEPVCIADEVPFDIPDSWEWVRFSSVVNYSMGKTPPRKEAEYWNNPIHSWVSIADMVADGHISRTKEGISEYAADKSFKGKKSPAGTLLMSFKLTVGKVSLLDIDAFHNEAIISIYPFVDDDKTMTSYLFAVMPLLSKLGETKTAIKGNTLNSDSLDKLWIPLPPFNEQKRICAKLNDLIPFIDKYGKYAQEVSTLRASFPELLKKSILQEAVQGKLVPQDPNDEPASVLLERIRAEKQALIKSGKIKKDKHESVIFRRDNSHYEKLNGIERCIDDEIPFEIPDNWEWCRLYSIVKKDIKRGKSPKYSECGQNLVFSQKCNTKHGTINLLLAKYLDEVTFTKYPTEEYLTNNDIIINSTGHGTLGRVGFFCGNDRISNAIIVPDSHITIIRCFETVTNKYIFYILKFYQPFLEKLGEGSTNQTELKPATIANLLIPMPPSNEQHKIVEKIEASLQFCKKL